MNDRTTWDRVREYLEEIRPLNSLFTVITLLVLTAAVIVLLPQRDSRIQDEAVFRGHAVLKGDVLVWQESPAETKNRLATIERMHDLQTAYVEKLEAMNAELEGVRDSLRMDLANSQRLVEEERTIALQARADYQDLRSKIFKDAREAAVAEEPVPALEEDLQEPSPTSAPPPPPPRRWYQVWKKRTSAK